MSTLRLNPRGNSTCFTPLENPTKKDKHFNWQTICFLLSFAGHIRLTAKYILVQLIISPRVLAAHWNLAAAILVFSIAWIWRHGLLSHHVTKFHGNMLKGFVSHVLFDIMIGLL